MSTGSIKRAPVLSIPSTVQANLATVQVFPDIVALNAVSIAAPSDAVLEQKKFLVRASGYSTTAGAFTVQLNLYAKLTLPTVASPGTLIYQSTARAQGTTSAPWYVEGELVFDSVSGKLHGTGKALINNLFDAPAALAAVLAGITGGTLGAEPALYFAVGIIFSVGNVGNIGVLGDFCLDA